MSHREYFTRRFLFQRVLQRNLVIGGSFNVSTSHFPPPTPGFYLQGLVALAIS